MVKEQKGKTPETAPVKKAGKKETAQKVEEIYLQYGAQEWNVAELKERAAAAYVAEGHRASGIRKLALYVKPEEGKAYFVINDKAKGDVDL